MSIYTRSMRERERQRQTERISLLNGEISAQRSADICHRKTETKRDRDKEQLAASATDRDMQKDRLKQSEANRGRNMKGSTNRNNVCINEQKLYIWVLWIQGVRSGYLYTNNNKNFGIRSTPVLSQ